jgi:zinc and cadmium transporter
MNFIWLWTIGSVVIVSLISLLGTVVIVASQKKLCQLITILVSLAVGAMFGDAFIHIIPELYSEGNSSILNSLFILVGVLFFVMEKFLHWHHYHHHHDKEQHIEPVGYLNLISDGLHNFIDGLIIAASFLIDREIGIATTLAVILHEIPQELGDFGLLLHAGFKKRQALLLNLLSASLAIVGAILILIIGQHLNGIIPFILAIAAGGFIYIAGSDLVPELHKQIGFKASLGQFFTVGLGIGVMFLLLLIE